MADLGRWLSGDYRVAGEAEASEGSPDGPADEDAEPRRDN